MLFVNLDELRANLNKVSTADDDELIDFAETAEAMVLTITGPISGPETVVETLWPREGVVVLRSAPVTSVTSVVDMGGTPVAHTADLAAGLVYPTGAFGIAYWNRLTVTYVVSANVDPMLLRQAVLMITQRLWETQRGNSPTILQGGDDQAPFTPGLQGVLADVRAMLNISGRPAIA